MSDDIDLEVLGTGAPKYEFHLVIEEILGLVILACDYPFHEDVISMTWWY